MPFITEENILDRSRALIVDMHPDLSGDMILTPDDLLRGDGDFIKVDADGSPLGFSLGKPELPDGRMIFIGATPDSCTQQTFRSLAHSQPTHLVDYALVDGPTPPDSSTPLRAKIPTPTAPVLTAVPLTRLGFVGSLPLSPYWYAWAFVDRFGNLTKMSNPVSFHAENGQALRVPLPARDDLEKGINEIALLVSEPNTSKPTRPGPMRVQRVVDLRKYFSDTFDLSGPYRFTGALAPTTNMTTLPNAPAPTIERSPAMKGARVGNYYARVVWTNRWGNTMPGTVSRMITIPVDERYTVRDEDGKVMFLSGRGNVAITRPQAPEGAEGWRLFVYQQPTHPDAGYSSGWRRAESKFLNFGGITPFPLEYKTILTAGWNGDERYYAGNDSCVLVEDPPDAPPDPRIEIPTLNTSFIPDPEGFPEAPVPFGPSRPEAGEYFIKTTDTVRGIQSLPSAASRITIADDQLISVAFVNDHNRVVNPTFIEQNPDGMPVGWNVTQGDPGVGYARMEGNDLVLGTNASATTGTPQATTPPIAIGSTAMDSILGYEVALEAPVQGPLAGTLEVVVHQTDAQGSILAGSTTLVAALTKTGEYSGEIKVLATSLVAGATHFAMIYRISGAARNMQCRASYTHMRQQIHVPRRPRRRKKPRAPRPGTPPRTSAIPRPGTPPTTAAPPRTIIADPPEPPWAPEATAVADPDRPRSAGVVEDSLTFEAGIPTSHAQIVTGTATLGVTAAASIGAGSTQGLQSKKATTGSMSSAYIERAYAPRPGFDTRHAQGAYLRNRLAVANGSGKLRMHELSRPSDKQGFAWLEATSVPEIVELTLDSTPLTGGSVGISLADAATQLVPVSSVAQVSDLSITAAPTASGQVAITLDGIRHNVTAGGNQQEFTITVNNIPSTAGNITLNINGVLRSIYVTPKLRRRSGSRVISVANTPALIAQQIATAGWTGYNITRVGRVITFQAARPGPRPAPTFGAGATRLSVTPLVTQIGTSETADELALRIRNHPYPGWTTAAGATPNVVRFTAVSGGVRAPLAYNPTTTGATGTTATVTAGSVETADALATKIRATAFTGWTVTGAGRVARFTATASGLRQASSYSHRGTGADGFFSTIQQGTASDVIACAREADGTILSKRIMRGISTSTIFNTDITVSGAGTERAVVTIWGSFGDAALEDLVRFEDVDLTGYPAGHMKIGVVSDAASSELWELHTDEVQATDRGRSYFRDHNALGEWIGQLEAYYEATQPIRQDLLLQDGRAATIPGKTYALSLFARADVASPLPARPLVLYRHDAKNGAVTEVGDVTGNLGGLTGRTGWKEYTITFTAPPDCREVSFGSRDIGAGSFVIQEVVFSPGTTPLRTYEIKAGGSYSTIFDLKTPKAEPSLAFWGRERIALGAVVDVPPTTAIAASYSSADASTTDPNKPGTFSTPTASPNLVPDRRFVKATFDATGSGATTPALKAGSPNAEYVLKLSDKKRMSVFLKGDRTELPGGTAFARLKGISSRRPDGRRVLPSGRLHDDPQLFAAVGRIPECELLVFSEETRQHIEENWKDPYCIEVFGYTAAFILLSSQPEFERQTITVLEGNADRPDLEPRSRHAVWKAKITPSEITSSLVMP